MLAITSKAGLFAKQLGITTCGSFFNRLRTDLCFIAVSSLLFVGLLLGTCYGFPPRQPSSEVASPTLVNAPAAEPIRVGTLSQSNHTLSYLYSWGSIDCSTFSQNKSICPLDKMARLGRVPVYSNVTPSFMISSVAISNSSLALNTSQSGQIASPKANTTTIFLADKENNLIEKFFVNGTPILKWGTRGTSLGQFYRPSALAASNDSLYIGDASGKIQVFDFNGRFKNSWGSLGALDRQFLNISGIAVAPALQGSLNNLSRMLNILPGLGGQLLMQSLQPSVSMISPGGRQVPELDSSMIYVLDSELDRVQVFYPNGTMARKFDVASEGQFSTPSATAIAIEPSQRFVYLGETGNGGKIRVFFYNGTLANQWNLTSATNVSIVEPTGLSFMGKDRLLVADSKNRQILEYFLNGTFVNRWNLTDSTPSTLTLRDGRPSSMDGPVSISSSPYDIGFIAVGLGNLNPVVYLFPGGADAGQDIYSQPGQTVILNGSKSSSPILGGMISSYSWKLINWTGNVSGILPFQSNNPVSSFLIPATIGDSILTFELNVTDSEGYNSSDLVKVHVRQPFFPVVSQLPPLGLYNITQPNTTPQYDKFGVLKVYPNKPGGEEWMMDMNNPIGDKRFDPQNQITKNTDGSWKMRSTQVRMGVFPSTGYKPQAITTTKEFDLERKGYMQGPNDWKNVEMTGYVKFNSGSEDNFAWYARGGRHTGSGPMEGCEGVAYKGDLYFSGKTQIAKEQWHVSYDYSPARNAIEPIKGKWVGFKFIIYNILLPDGRTGVKMENWVDRNSDQHWQKIYEYTDSGGWGREGSTCGGRPDQIVSWGGPIATYRWDSANDVDFKYLSVREINGQAGPGMIPAGGQPFNATTTTTTGTGTTTTQEPGTTRTDDHVAIFRNYVHTIWEEPVGRNLQVFYKRSTDGGKTYDKTINLSNSSEDAFDAKIKIWKTNIIGVVFREGNDIFYTSSKDNGVTFSVPENVSKSPNTISTDPNIEIADGMNVKIIWVEHDAPEVMEPVDHTNGNNSQPTNALWSFGQSKTFQTVSMNQVDKLHLVAGQSNIDMANQTDKKMKVKSQLMMIESSDAGKSFSEPKSVAVDKDLEMHTPEMATTSNGKTYLCFVKGIEDNTDVYCSHSEGAGLNFTNSTNVTNDPSAPSLTPKLSASGDSVYLAWSDLKNGTGGNLDVFSMVAKDDNSTFGGLTNLSNDTAGSVNPDVAVSNGTVHAVWGENTPGNNSIISSTSNNSGLTYEKKVISVSNDTLVSHPQIATSGNEVVILTSSQNKSGDQNIVLTKSNDSGISFENETNLTENMTSTTNQTTAALGQNQTTPLTNNTGIIANVSSVNNRPVANNSEFTVQIGSPVTIDLKQLTSDKDHDALSARITEQPSYGNIDTTNINSTGVILYTPHDPNNSSSGPALPSGGQDSFKYDVFDGKDYSNNAIVTIKVLTSNAQNQNQIQNQTTPLTNNTGIIANVSSVNNRPVANNSEFTVQIGSPVTIDLKQLTSDKDHDALSARITEQPSYGNIDTTNINSTGVIFYTPHDPSNPSAGPALSAGGQDSFKYDVFDGRQYSDNALVKIKIVPSTATAPIPPPLTSNQNQTQTQPTPVPLPNQPASNNNNAPVANDFSVSLNSDQPIRINLVANSTDIDGDKLRVFIVTQPKFSASPISINNYDNTTVNYQQFSDITTQKYQEDSFAYQVSDGKSMSNVAVVKIVPQQQQFPSGEVESVPPLMTNQQAPSPPAVTPRSNQPPVSKDVSGEVSPEGSTEIMLDATDTDSSNLTAIIVKGPDCGSQTLNQQIGSLLYTAKSVQDITNSLCTGDSVNGWLDTITYKVSDGESDSNVATIRIKIQPTAASSPSNQDHGPEIESKVRITGPKSAGPGENVTLIGNLTGINPAEISGARFTQEQGANLSYSECSPSAISQCTYPSVSFIMPNCPTDDNIFRFTLIVTKNNLTRYSDDHTVKLACHDNQKHG